MHVITSLSAILKEVIRTAVLPSDLPLQVLPLMAKDSKEHMIKYTIVIEEAEKSRHTLETLFSELKTADQALKSSTEEANSAEQRLKGKQAALAVAKSDQELLKQVVPMLGRQGVRAFVARSALHDLEENCNDALSSIAGGSMQVALAIRDCECPSYCLCSRIRW